MKALQDWDILQWEFGDATTDDGRPLNSWPLIQSRVQGRINGIMEATGADSYQGYITTDDKSNFRYDVATIQPYKGNRKGKEKPRWYQQIRNFLVDHRGAIEVQGMEADDAISIAQRTSEEETVICSRDKDLNIVPGNHYSWACGNQKEKPLWYQTEIGGLRCFYKQLLTGDTVDNILGLYRVGQKSTYCKDLDSIHNEFKMYTHVKEQYDKRFGSYSEKFLEENGRLLWMLEYEGQVWRPPQAEDHPSTEEESEQEEPLF